MMRGKAAYLSALTSRFRFHSQELKENMSGSTPPSVFIGSYGYPKVIAGPMLTAQTGDTSLLDMPESWLPQNHSAQNIIDFRLQLIRGKSVVGIKELDNRLVGQLQEIALASGSVDAEAEFTSKPRGWTINEEHQPFGPSAPLKRFDPGNAKMEPHLEKVYYDTDLKAADGVVNLYKRGLAFSQIQKAFSAATMGISKNRRLVPTRWSITAVDDILGKNLLKNVKQNPVIDGFYLYEHTALNNYFAVLLTPTMWQYEWLEAFIGVLGSERVLFSDWEPFEGKKGYSPVGGCYYSVRFAVAEALARMGRQAGALVFREAYPGYTPLGVWNCRENVRTALKGEARNFVSLREALQHVSGKLWLPQQRWFNSSTLLKRMLTAPVQVYA